MNIIHAYNHSLNCHVIIRDGVSLYELNNWTNRSRWKQVIPCIVRGRSMYYIQKKTYTMWVTCDDTGYTHIEITRCRHYTKTWPNVKQHVRKKLIERINNCLFNSIQRE